jgi:hypothetical protein
MIESQRHIEQNIKVKKYNIFMFLSSILWQKDFNLRGKKFFDAGKF